MKVFVGQGKKFGKLLEVFKGGGVLLIKEIILAAVGRIN